MPFDRFAHCCNGLGGGFQNHGYGLSPFTKVVSILWHRRDEALQRLSNWQRAGQIKFKEDVLEGIERMPEGFLRLLSGKNFGKQIIKIV